jgi:FkbM family methyltransferase
MKPAPTRGLSESGWRYFKRQLRWVLYFRLLKTRYSVLKQRHMIAAVATDFIGERICLDGNIEVREIAVLRELLSARGVGTTLFLDIGANVGGYSLALADLFAAVYAFEPNPVTHELLRFNLRLNKAANVTAFAIGLSDEDRIASFEVNRRNSGASRFSESDRGDGERMALPLRSGDAFMDEQTGTAAHAIGFIKCDVEGMELSVFRGLARTLQRDRPGIFFESIRPPDGQACIDFLRTLGYSQFFVVGESYDTVPPPWRWLLRASTGVRFKPRAVESLSHGPVNVLALAT